MWQFKSSWEDRIIGGRLTVKGRCVRIPLLPFPGSRPSLVSLLPRHQPTAGAPFFAAFPFPPSPPLTNTHTRTHRELQFSKTWLVTLGDQDDIATRLKFRAGIDTGTWRSYARLGFRYVE